jgi:hypothetical protein
VPRDGRLSYYRNLRRVDYALKPVEVYRASGPLKQEPSGEQLKATLGNLRPSGRRGCQKAPKI